MDRVIRNLTRCILIALFTWTFVTGSKITLTASRPSIQPLLTSLLTLRCTLDDTPTSSSVIGRSLASTPNKNNNNNNNYDDNLNTNSNNINENNNNMSKNDETDSSPHDHAHRSVSSTPLNAKFVSSMFLFLNDEDVASVSEHVPARAVAQHLNVNVSGDIPGKYGEQGVLEVNVTYPTESQGGNYSCKVTAIDDVGHSVVYSDSVDVDVTTPTVADLVHYVHNLQMEENNNKAEITRLQHEDDANKAEINANKAEINANKAEITALKSALDIASHVESGVFRCGRLGAGSPVARNQSVSFNQTYTNTPTVHVSLIDFGVWKDYHAYFYVKLMHADTLGFTVQCSLHSGDKFVEWLDFSWLSVPRV